MYRILFINEDRKTQGFIRDFLEEEGYPVTIAQSGIDALDIIDDQTIDLVLLDEEVKDITRRSICRQIKKTHPNIRIILLVEDFKYQKVNQLYKLGADDFITKPLDLNLLLGRIKLIFTESKQNLTHLKVHNLQLNLKRKRVKRGDQEIDLSPTEYKLLEHLMNNRGRVLSRKMILSRVWSFNSDVQTRVVDVYIGYLREKIDQNFDKKLIQTVPGFGYMISD